METQKQQEELSLQSSSPPQPPNNNNNNNNNSENINNKRRAVAPKRFVKNQIPDSITNNAALNSAISLLPSNYNFEVHKCVWRVLSSKAKRVALQFPEGLLMFSLHLSDILTTFGGATHCFVLGDVTYGACCLDDLSASALRSDLLIHFGHSCLIPLDSSSLPCLYVFVTISFPIPRFLSTLRHNFSSNTTTQKQKQIVLAGTIQFAPALRAAKLHLENEGFRVLIPQAKPLSAGEVLGCTAPRIQCSIDDDVVAVFVADGRFHLEAFMIANPGVRTFRYDPYIGGLFLEEYDGEGMREARRRAIERAREARSWGVVLGTLGRQGNPRILERLERKMGEKGLSWVVVLMSEISPARVALFGDAVDAWIQIACPRLSIDWGDAFAKPLLTPFEAEIALGLIPGWWERERRRSVGVGAGCCAESGSCSGCGNGVRNGGVGEYPMDYYAQDGGEWNSCYGKKTPSRPDVRRRNHLPSVSANGAAVS